MTRKSKQHPSDKHSQVRVSARMMAQNHIWFPPHLFHNQEISDFSFSLMLWGSHILPHKFTKCNMSKWVCKAHGESIVGDIPVINIPPGTALPPLAHCSHCIDQEDNNLRASHPQLSWPGHSQDTQRQQENNSLQLILTVQLSSCPCSALVTLGLWAGSPHLLGCLLQLVSISVSLVTCFCLFPFAHGKAFSQWIPWPDRYCCCCSGGCTNSMTEAFSGQ